MKDNNTTAVPKEWPGAFAIYKISRDRVRNNLGALILLAILPFAINFMLGLLLGSSSGAKDLRQLLSSLISVYFMVVATRAYLLTARQERIDLSAAFRIPASLYWKMLLLELLTCLSVIGGLILLIVPGIIIGMRLSLAPYYLVDKNLSTLDAYKASWHATKGHLGKLWGLIGVAVLMILPILTIIGIIATIYLLFMYSAAGALFYLYLLKNHQKETA